MFRVLACGYPPAARDNIPHKKNGNCFHAWRWTSPPGATGNVTRLKRVLFAPIGTNSTAVFDPLPAIKLPFNTTPGRSSG